MVLRVKVSKRSLLQWFSPSSKLRGASASKLCSLTAKLGALSSLFERIGKFKAKKRKPLTPNYFGKLSLQLQLYTISRVRRQLSQNMNVQIWNMCRLCKIKKNQIRPTSNWATNRRNFCSFLARKTLSIHIENSCSCSPRAPGSTDGPGASSPESLAAASA